MGPDCTMTPNTHGNNTKFGTQMKKSEDQEDLIPLERRENDYFLIAAFTLAMTSGGIGSSL